MTQTQMTYHDPSALRDFSREVAVGLPVLEVFRAPVTTNDGETITHRHAIVVEISPAGRGTVRQAILDNGSSYTFGPKVWGSIQLIGLAAPAAGELHPSDQDVDEYLRRRNLAHAVTHAGEVVMRASVSDEQIIALTEATAQLVPWAAKAGS